MRKKSKKTTSKKTITPKKIDGRSKEGRALKAKAAARKDKKDGRKLAKFPTKPDAPKRKYTRRTPSHEDIMDGFPTAKAEPISKKAAKYTPDELQQAENYFNNVRSDVVSTIKNALKDTPREEWNKFTHVNVNSNTKKLNTEAVAAVLGV